MANEHSFDISASVDKQEVKNAIEQAKKEVGSRYDFKGIEAVIDYKEKEKAIEIISSSDSKVDAIKDIILSKLIKRNIPVSALNETKREPSSGSNVKATLAINDVIDQENAKKITKHIKELKLKVNASIRGEEVRVVGKSIDDLQACIQAVKQMSLSLPLSFVNLK